MDRQPHHRTTGHDACLTSVKDRVELGLNRNTGLSRHIPGTPHILSQRHAHHRLDQDVRQDAGHG